MSEQDKLTQVIESGDCVQITAESENAADCELANEIDGLSAAEQKQYVLGNTDKDPDTAEQQDIEITVRPATAVNPYSSVPDTVENAETETAENVPEFDGKNVTAYRTAAFYEDTDNEVVSAVETIDTQKELIEVHFTFCYAENPPKYGSYWIQKNNGIWEAVAMSNCGVKRYCKGIVGSVVVTAATRHKAIVALLHCLVRRELSGIAEQSADTVESEELPDNAEQVAKSVDSQIFEDCRDYAESMRQWCIEDNVPFDIAELRDSLKTRLDEFCPGYSTRHIVDSVCREYDTGNNPGGRQSGNSTIEFLRIVTLGACAVVLAIGFAIMQAPGNAFHNAAQNAPQTVQAALPDCEELKELGIIGNCQ